MHLRKAKLTDRGQQMAQAAAGAGAGAGVALLAPQFFQPVTLDDVMDNLILKNVRHILINVAGGNFFHREINYKKLVLALSIEHGEAMRKKILDLLLNSAKMPEGMLARRALIEALPFLNEKEQIQIVTALIKLYARRYKEGFRFERNEFSLDNKDWNYFITLIDKVCRVDLDIRNLFLCRVFLNWTPFISSKNLKVFLPLIQQAIIDGQKLAGNNQGELFYAANRALERIQCSLRRRPLLARGAAVPMSLSLDALLNKALNEKDPNIEGRRQALDKICDQMNAANHCQILERLWTSMRNKSGAVLLTKYAALLAKAFEFASPQNREAIKSCLLFFLEVQALSNTGISLEFVKKIMWYMHEPEFMKFVRAAINKINCNISVDSDSKEAIGALAQNGSNLAAFELLRQYQIIREQYRRELDNQLEGVLQDVLSDQSASILIKPVTAIVAGYAKRFN